MVSTKLLDSEFKDKAEMQKNRESRVEQMQETDKWTSQKGRDAG